MTSTLTFPKLSPAQLSIVKRYLGVFIAAFATQLLAGLTPHASISTLFAGVSSAVAAGFVAVLKGVKMVGALQAQMASLRAGRVGISLKIETAGYELLTTVAVMFVGTLGTQLALHSYGASTLPKLADVLATAVAAAVWAVAQYLIGLIRKPATS